MCGNCFCDNIMSKKKKNNVDQIDDKNASKCEKVFQIILKKRNEK